MIRIFRKCCYSLMICGLIVNAANAQSDIGLLLVAHGAADPQWNKPVMDFGGRINEMAMVEGKFKAVRTVLLEDAQPDVSTGMEELKSAGCKSVVVVPLFIAPSSHTLDDLPAELGLKTRDDEEKEEVDEGDRLAPPEVPVIVTPALDDGDVLFKFALRQVQKLSKQPEKEAIVLLAHGDDPYHRLIDRPMARTLAYCCGQTGIDYGNWAYIEMGQKYTEEGIPAIEQALKHKQRVLVVAMYLNTSAKRMHKMAIDKAMKAGKLLSDPSEGKDVVFSDEVVLRDPDLAKQVLEMATRAAATPVLSQASVQFHPALPSATAESQQGTDAQ